MALVSRPRSPPPSPLFTIPSPGQRWRCGRVPPTISLSPHHHRTSVGRCGRVSPHFPLSHTINRPVSGVRPRFPLTFSPFTSLSPGQRWGCGRVPPTPSPFHHTITGSVLRVAAAFSLSPYHRWASFGHCGRVPPFTIPSLG
ncbi:MAG: hypothetical protein V9G20_26590 [Candidatus Promineifilaceae bacterium]